MLGKESSSIVDVKFYQLELKFRIKLDCFDIRCFNNDWLNWKIV